MSENQRTHRNNQAASQSEKDDRGSASIGNNNSNNNKAVQVDVGFSLSGDSLLIDEQRNCYNEQKPQPHSGDDDESMAYAERESNLTSMLRQSREEWKTLTEQEVQQEKLKREKQALRYKILESHGRQKELKSVVGDLQMSINDLRIKYKEQTTMYGLKDMERSEAIRSLNSKVERLMRENRLLTHLLESIKTSQNCSADNQLPASLPDSSTGDESNTSLSEQNDNSRSKGAVLRTL